MKLLGNLATFKWLRDWIWRNIPNHLITFDSKS